MKFRKLAAVCSLTAYVAAMVPALADQAQKREDVNGLRTLGFDVSGVWSSPEGVQKFLAGLDPASRVLVFSGCASVTNSPFAYNPKLQLFCNFATAPELEGRIPTGKVP